MLLISGLRKDVFLIKKIGAKVCLFVQITKILHVQKIRHII